MFLLAAYRPLPIFHLDNIPAANRETPDMLHAKIDESTMQIVDQIASMSDGTPHSCAKALFDVLMPDMDTKEMWYNRALAAVTAVLSLHLQTRPGRINLAALQRDLSLGFGLMQSEARRLIKKDGSRVAKLEDLALAGDGQMRDRLAREHGLIPMALLWQMEGQVLPAEVRNYFDVLPGFSWGSTLAGDPPLQATQDMHAFAVMGLAKAIGRQLEQTVEAAG